MGLYYWKKKNNVFSFLLRLVKIGYLKVISSKSFLFRGYGVPVNAAPKLHPSGLATQKGRHMFLRLWGIQTRYCAPIRTRSIYHSSWVLQPSQRKLKTILTQNFGGQEGALWEMCEWRVLFRPRFSFRVAVTHLAFRTKRKKYTKKPQLSLNLLTDEPERRLGWTGFQPTTQRQKKCLTSKTTKSLHVHHSFFLHFLAAFVRLQRENA